MRRHVLAAEPALGTALEQLFPDRPGLRAVAVTALPDLDNPFPHEESDEGMAPARRREFRVGRACAREALQRVGAPGGPIPAGRWGEPVWPAGYCGSIAHSEGLVAAVAMACDARVGLGVDVELPGRGQERGTRIFCTAREQAWMAGAGEPPVLGGTWGDLFFCVKESIFKAQLAEVTGNFGLGDFSVVVDGEAGRFRVEQATEGPHREGLLNTNGRFALVHRHVAAGAVRESP